MSNIVSLKGNATIPEANAQCVERLEELLQMAKDGQLIGIIYAGIVATDATCTGWTAAPDGRDYGIAMIRLQHEFGRHQAGAWDA